jgi:hypothetical protein
MEIIYITCFNVQKLYILPIQCIYGFMRPGRDADHSYPSTAEVKNE